MTYEELLIHSFNEGLYVKEKKLVSSNGRIKGRRVAIRKELSEIEKQCTLAEELGHYYTSVGDIIRIKNESDIKQEYRARIWAYKKLVSFESLIECFEARCLDKYDYIERLNVTETFFNESIDYYKKKYGLLYIYNNYVIYFEPTLAITKFDINRCIAY